MRFSILMALTPMVLGLTTLAGAARAESCEDLTKAAVPGAVITTAKVVAFGEPQEIGTFGIPPLPAAQAYCRIDATLSPTPNSSIRVEVWLPSPSAWNGKLLASGNGGYGGSLGGPRLTMRAALHRGYATAGTDLGHSEDGSSGENAAWALGQPDRIIDFGYRANHLTALFAKAVATRYYGAAPRRAYFQGCSDGGREALMEARRFPDDYDGIIAGAPANAWTRLMTAFAWDWRAAHPGGVQLIPDAKLATIQTASLAACDGLDGVKDGLVNDPRLCKFDPATIACKGADGPDCLTAAQVEGLRQIYQGPKDPRTGKALFPGFPAGAEATPVSWTLWISGEKAQHGAFARSFFGDFVFNDANWKIDELDFSKDPAQADARMAAILNSDDPDLTAFKARGGKLILYHGWADAAITPYSTLQYYDAVRRTMGAEAADSFSRLYMVPGMAHCLGGPGPNTFDMLTALEGWSEKGEAPGAVIASKYANDFAGLLDVPPGLALRSRPLCAYPKTAHWTGAGSSDEAANWRCEAPPRADS